jgi:hypothetical protein
VQKIRIAALNDPNAVLKAMARYDDVGRDEFLKEDNYKPAREYFLVHDHRVYDSKAIAGVAYGIQHDERVTPGQFSGGEATVARTLEGMGFTVTRPEPHSSTAWDEDEMLLALHRYLAYRSETLGADHPVIRDLSVILERLAVSRGRLDVARARGPAEVARRLAGFAILDPKGAPPAGAELSCGHADAWARWAEAVYARTRRAAEILGELEGTGPPVTPAAVRGRLAEAWGVEDSGGAPEASEPSLTPDALLAGYGGRREVKNRTAAEPRVEDPGIFDRANEAHEDLRELLVRVLLGHGFRVHDSSTVAKRRNIDFDLAAEDGSLWLVVEVKSMPADVIAEAGRLRAGLGQVLWYRHRFFAYAASDQWRCSRSSAGRRTTRTGSRSAAR